MSKRNKSVVKWTKNLRKDPFARIVARSLKKIIEDVPEEQILENLDSLHKPYMQYKTFLFGVEKGSFSTRDFIKVMVASGIKEYTIKILDDDFEKISQLIQESEVK